MQAYYEFFNPVKIISGVAALEQLPGEIRALQLDRPLVITDEGIRKAGLLKHLNSTLDSSGLAAAPVFDRVPADSSLQVVRDVAEIYRQEQCDAVIALGGGSVMDTAKAVNILASLGGDDLLQYAGAHVIPHALRPLIALPTTSGTGSEATLVAVIKDEQHTRKLAFVSPFLLPNVALIDPRFTLALPAGLTAATAMDALTHAVEAYTCLAKNPLSDMHAKTAIQWIVSQLPNVLDHPEDKALRLTLANAATMAGIAFSNSMVGMVHALGHTVGAHCGLSHGEAMSILLPHVLEYNLAHANESYSRHLGELALVMLGAQRYVETAENRRAATVIAFIRQLKTRLRDISGLPATLKDTGKVAYPDLKTIAEAAVYDPSTIYNPAEMDAGDAFVILQEAYQHE